jgi:SIR2-like protein
VPTTITDADWYTIVESIEDGLCVPFLGAAVNLSVDGYAGLPLGYEVAERLLAPLVGKKQITFDEFVTVTPGPLLTPADEDDEQVTALKELLQDLIRVRAEDLARVALHVESGAGKGTLVKRLKKILTSEECKPSRILTTIAELPIRLVVTTNYDELMEEAYRRAEPAQEPLVIPQPLNGFKPAQRARWAKELAAVVPKNPGPRQADERPIVYKIHGSLGEDFGELIVSEEDYIGFLDTLGRNRKAGVPTLIQDLVVQSRLLFLGYSLEDWDFRTLWKGLVEPIPTEQKRVSFAIQKDPSPFWVRFWQAKQVTIYNVDLYEFVDELREKLQ